jgi:hypothetical protein
MFRGHVALGCFFVPPLQKELHMSTNGWGLTARLISKHFSALGDKVSEAIANFDPETATEADRDRLQATLLSTAQKLAAARADFSKEHQDVVNLQNLLANDERALSVLAQRLEAGSISEDAVKLFCDELEANKARLPQEMQEEADAKQYLDEIQKIVDAFSKQLAEFDAVAKRAKTQLANAQAQKDLQEMRLTQQQELSGLKAMGANSTALGALTRRAQKVSNEASGMKIVADINQKPIDNANEIAAIRASVASAAAPAESTLERLKRLSAK